MELVEVTNAALRKQFLETPVLIYRNDPNWIRPLDRDIENVFDPNKNKRFRHGAATRWVLFDPRQKPIGRVAAFFDERKEKHTEVRAGGMGFFECVNDFEAARRLFDACKQWLMTRNFEAVDGPINFGERDAWWGLMIDGFMPPTYRMNYNPPYYQTLFEQYGFREYFNQFVYAYEVNKPVPESFYERGLRAKENLGITVRPIRLHTLRDDAADIASVYNAAWANMDHFKPISSDQAYQTLRNFRAIIEPRLIYLAHQGNKPIGFFIMLPEVNQIVARLNGRFNWWAKCKFYYYLKTKAVDKIFGVLFGVIPEFQGKGVEAAMIIDAAAIVQKQLAHYTLLELNWIGDFNPRMIRVVENLGTKLIRRYRTYRLLFDPDRPYQRYPIQY